MTERQDQSRRIPTPRPVPPRPGKVVIAGGTGFIGRHLSARLAAAGHRVLVLSRRPPPAGRKNQDKSQDQVSGNAGNGVSYEPWDPAAPGPWTKALEGADAVINLCGASLAAGRWTDKRKRELVESRTIPSHALVTACNALDVPPAVLLQASGVNFYGVGEAEHDEHSPAGHDFLARLASEWEAPLDNTLIRTVSLRFGAVLDSREGALPQMLLPFRLFVGGPIAGGRQWLSWIHIEDAVSAIVFAMDSPLVDAVNVTSPHPVRNADFARCAGQVLRRPALTPMPGFVLRAALGEQATLVCDGVQAVPAKLEIAGFDFRFPAIGSALANLMSA